MIETEHQHVVLDAGVQDALLQAPQPFEIQIGADRHGKRLELFVEMGERDAADDVAMEIETSCSFPRTSRRRSASSWL